MLRLKADLEGNGCFVVYFATAGDDGDIDVKDVQCTDIVLACTRYLLEELQNADPAPLVSWFKAQRVQDRIEALLQKQTDAELAPRRSCRA